MQNARYFPISCIDSNAITSIYGKDYSIARVLHDAIEQETNGLFRLFYLDENKATAFLQEARVPMPKNPATHNGGYIRSLTDANSPDKLKFSDVTESQQFKRFPIQKRRHCTLRPFTS